MTLEEAFLVLATIDEWSVRVTPSGASMRVATHPLRVLARRRRDEATSELIVRAVQRYQAARLPAGATE